MNFSVNIWKIRSTIYHNTQIPPTELNIRQEAYTLLLNLKSSPTTLPAANRNLLNRNRRFFLKSTVRQIHAWVGRVNTAVLIKKRIDEKGKRDIRKFCYRIFAPINFHYDFPDYDTDATENFPTHYPDEDPVLDIWGTNKNLSVLNETQNSLPETNILNSNRDSNFFQHRDSK